MKKKSLKVRVFFSPIIEKEDFEKEVLSVSSKNGLGNFDILPGHTNFISLIFDNLTMQTLERKKMDYEFTRGVLIVKENTVDIFLGV